MTNKPNRNTTLPLADFLTLASGLDSYIVPEADTRNLKKEIRNIASKVTDIRHVGKRTKR